jgi:transposase
MQMIMTIGQHDATGKVIMRRQLKRRFAVTFFEKLPPYLVGIEACASSQYWSRQLQAWGTRCG